MMPAAFGPVLPATSWIPGMLACAEKTPSDFAREVPEGTRYVAKSAHRGRCPLPPQPTTSVQGARWLSGNTVLQQAAFWIQSSHAELVDTAPWTLAQVWSPTAPTAWAVTPWRACGEPRVPGIPRRAIESLHASHVHRVARRWAGPKLAAGHGDTAISPPWG